MNLPKFPIVPHKDFVPFGISSYVKQNEQDYLKHFGSIFDNLKAQYIGL
jgi:hypothetical protein